MFGISLSYVSALSVLLASAAGDQLPNAVIAGLRQFDLSSFPLKLVKLDIDSDRQAGGRCWAKGGGLQRQDKEGTPPRFHPVMDKRQIFLDCPCLALRATAASLGYATVFHREGHQPGARQEVQEAEEGIRTSDSERCSIRQLLHELTNLQVLHSQHHVGDFLQSFTLTGHWDCTIVWHLAIKRIRSDHDPTFLNGLSP